MEFVDILIIISAVVIILTLWIVVGMKHFQHLKKEIEDKWEVLSELLRKRHNLVPNLVETVRKYDDKQEKLMEELINGRMQAAKEYRVGAKKIEYEHDLTKTLNRVIDLGRMLKELAKDTNFLELRREIESLERDTEVRSGALNKIVRKYNRDRRKIFLIPISGVFRFKNENIFEFEK